MSRLSAGRALARVRACVPARAGGWWWRVVGCCCGCVVGLGLLCGVAWGARGHVFVGGFGSAGSGGGEFSGPSGVAVDEASGVVYVVDRGDDRVEWFSEAGVFEGQFNGSGEYEVEGEPESGLAAADGVFAGPEAIAVDNSCSFLRAGPGEENAVRAEECRAADPSAGDVYVFDTGHEVVDKFSATGEYLGDISAAKEGLEQPDGVAVDRDGNVFVGVNSGAVSFNDEEPNERNKRGFIGGKRADEFDGPGLAVASEGGEDVFYLRDRYDGVIFKVGPEGCAGLGGECGGNGFSQLEGLLDEAFAVSGPWFSTEDGVERGAGSGDVYVDHGNVVVRQAPGGEALEELGGEAGLGELSAGAGVGVDAATGRVYVAEGAGDEVFVFGPKPAGAPVVASEGVSGVTAESARLEASVQPDLLAGEEAAEYVFEYGECRQAGGGTSRAACASAEYETFVPLAAGVLGTGFEPVAVSQEVHGLTAGATYHVRVLARNAFVGGKEWVAREEWVAGGERVFVTQGVGRVRLPDDRAWEMVSPADKHGANLVPLGAEVPVQAAAGGGGMVFDVDTPTETGPSGYTAVVPVLATRGGAGWTSRDLTIAHEYPTRAAVGTGNEYRIFSTDLSHAVVQPQGPLVACRTGEGVLQPCLSAHASEQTAFLQADFLDEDTGDACVQPAGGELLAGAAGCFEPLVTAAAGAADVPAGTVFGEEGSCAPPEPAFAFCGPQFVAASANLEHVVLSSPVALNAAGGDLFEWTAGEQIQPVTLLPKGEGGGPASDATLGLNGEDTRNAVSADGSRVFWSVGTSSDTPGELYVRDTVKEESLLVGGGAVFQGASGDGSRVFFSSSTSGGSLTECVLVEGVGGALECEDTVVAAGGVLGAIPGVSEDGSWVYFVSTDVLAAGGVAGAPNLYVYHEGERGLVAVLSKNDFPDWAGKDPGNLSDLTARVSPDGRWLAFMSERGLTGYDTRDVVSGVADEEVYLYHAPERLGAEAGQLVCASCDPSGARPVGEEAERVVINHGGVVGGEAWKGSGDSLAATVPAFEPFRLKDALYQPRFLSDSGRVFFDARDGLVSGASGGGWDVYEWEPEGDGPAGAACGAGAGSGGVVFEPAGEVVVEGRVVGVPAGCVGLISGGEAGTESAFLDASESGGEVFFMTTARLSPRDTDDSYDVYDAHECTVLSPCLVEGPVLPPACDNEASCRPAPTPQPEVYGAPASATFSGPGNITEPEAKKTTTTTALTSAQKLAKALKACRAKHARAKRVACERQARRRYAPAKKAAAGHAKKSSSSVKSTAPVKGTAAGRVGKRVGRGGL